MNFRGPVLIFFSVAMIGTAALFMQREKAGELVPGMIETVAGAKADCDAHGYDTAIGRMGCNSSRQQNTGPVRSTRAGGALFETVGSN